MKKNGTEKKAAEKKGQEKLAADQSPKANGTAKKESTVEKDKFGFRKGTHSSEAVSQLAAGKTRAEVRKAFTMLSFSKLIQAVEGHGFAVREDGKGKCSVVKA